MAEFSMLESVKKGMGFGDNDYHDDVLQEKIDEVTEYLIAGGVPEAIATSRRCKGVVERGVTDIWDAESGKAALSPYFKERAAQLAMKWGGSVEST